MAGIYGTSICFKWNDKTNDYCDEEEEKDDQIIDDFYF